MNFPDLNQAKERLIESFADEAEIALSDIRVIASPYRICPLGAHIDHQGGPVLGMTINAYTLMAFTPKKESQVKLRSENYPGKVKFDLRQIPEATGSFWGVYARAAALALQEKYPLKHGFIGIIDGMLPGCGLSSSASVLLAYLYALADIHNLKLEPWDFVNLTRKAENNYIGLNNGILDQTSIVFGEFGQLLHIDTKEVRVDKIADKLGETRYRILVAYSGFSRELTTTGYNSRVAECQEAAAQLSMTEADEPVKMLSDVSENTFHQHGNKLAPHLLRRANHYFSEVRRVRDGIKAWQDGQLEAFGHLMLESCRSSIEQYECGSPAIHDLQQIMSSAEGVIGSRFSGGGFGGCVVGLVKPSRAAIAAEEIQSAYRQLHPEVADQAAVYIAGSADGVRFL